MEHPAGESDDGVLRVDFDRRLRLQFHGARITSDAGLLAHRELDAALGLTDLAGASLSDGRRRKNTRHLLTGLLRPGEAVGEDPGGRPVSVLLRDRRRSHRT